MDANVQSFLGIFAQMFVVELLGKERWETPKQKWRLIDTLVVIRCCPSGLKGVLLLIFTLLMKRRGIQLQAVRRRAEKINSLQDGQTLL